jgi:hypothetical protein
MYVSTHTLSLSLSLSLSLCLCLCLYLCLCLSACVSLSCIPCLQLGAPALMADASYPHTLALACIALPPSHRAAPSGDVLIVLRIAAHLLPDPAREILARIHLLEAERKHLPLE